MACGPVATACGILRFNAERGGERNCGALPSTSASIGDDRASFGDADSKLRDFSVHNDKGGEPSICEPPVPISGRGWGVAFSEGPAAPRAVVQQGAGGGVSTPHADRCSADGDARSPAFIRLATPAGNGGARRGSGDSGAAGYTTQPSSSTQQEGSGYMGSRVHSPGEAVNRPSRDVVSGSVEGLSTRLGEVADKWEGWGGPHRDLGAEDEPDGVDSAGAVAPISAYPRVKLVMDWNAEIKKGRRGTGCRVGACQIARAMLKKERDDLEQQLRIERQSRSTLVTGDIRAMQVSYEEKDKQLQDNLELLRQMRNERNKWANKAAELGAASIEQTKQIADLKGQVMGLNNMIKERARESKRVMEEALAERKRNERNERKREREISKMDILSEACLAEAEQRAHDAQLDAAAARTEAENARDDALAEAALVESSHEWAMHLLEKRLKWQTEKASRARAAVANLPSTRTAEQWAQLSAEATRQAARRERASLTSFLQSHEWRACDLAAVISELGMLEAVFDSKPGTVLYLARVQKMLEEMEKREFGERFALFLHFEMQLTLDKVHRIMQAGCKAYSVATNRYAAKVLVYDKFHKGNVVKVPRIAPPRHRVEAVLRRIYDQLGTEISEDGRIAYTSLSVVVQEMLMQDAGRYGMPPLPAFLGGELKLPIVISWDGTGYGNQQFTTIVARNPYAPKSA